MKTKILLITILIFSIGCNIKNEQSKSNSKQLKAKRIVIEKKDINKRVRPQKALSKDISLIETEHFPVYWTDKGSFYALFFELNKVYFQFNPTCIYWFPSKIINNEIIFYWALNPDCVFDRGLEKTYLNIENPTTGKPFGKIKLLSDTTFIIDYYYADWVKKINEEQYKYIDTLFPSYFYKKKWNN